MYSNAFFCNLGGAIIFFELQGSDVLLLLGDIVVSLFLFSVSDVSLITIYLFYYLCTHNKRQREITTKYVSTRVLLISEEISASSRGRLEKNKINADNSVQ